MDSIHLIASALTFSIANVSDNYANNGWPYVVPYSLPLAQVSSDWIFSDNFLISWLSDLHDSQRLSDHNSDRGEIFLCRQTFLTHEKQVRQNCC